MGGFHSRTPGYNCPFCCNPRDDQLCWRSGLGASVGGTALLRGSGHRTPLPFIQQTLKPQISVLEELERFLPQHRKQTVHCLPSRPTAQHTKTGQEGNTLLYSQTKPALSTNPKLISFPFSFWEKRPDLIVSPIWCTFTVRKNEFRLSYMCQIMTSGRKKNLHF